ncbi:AfsR/SARP family transcriptional regulator [Saccharothrix obliqua]|uniref:AfsR/SARP family transcriptional regulator n=1 Tax=Saccharothrix obliqua TaxID=2861747 RepID=UPI001C5D788D|nr:AfsR/SARP family transcriptional regulator [Saccharothrix obliqua]MBW4717232.1 AfsR/SARP family transcriptional regulator [Saccharothrix obliqua]
MAIEFRLLGPVEALIDGEPVDLGSPRQICVLALLLVEANHVVPTGRLLERVWPDRLPRSARGTLSSYLSRLRKRLAGAVSLTRRSGGYVLAVDPGSVDLHRFHALLGRARADDGHAPALLSEALGLWRDDAFTGVDCAWLDRLGGTLAAERRAAQRDWTDLQLRLGHHGALVPGLVDQVEDDPLDERLIGQLMLAQHRAGRRADALGTFARACLRLRRDLGIGPGGPLRRLHREILSAGEPAGRPPRPRRACQVHRADP